MNIQEIYNHEFVDLTLEIKSYLNKIKEQCDEFDRTRPSEHQQVDFIEKHKSEAFNIIDEHFFKIWPLAQDFSEEEIQRHRRFYQKELVPFFEVSPYNKRVYEKPLGYAGDFVVMIYLYENGYEGESTFAKFIHRYSMNVPAARANHNRKEFYKKHINDVLERIDTPKITSIASGPAVEIIEILNENPLARNAIFTCLDFEILALDYVKEKVQSLEEKHNFRFNINYKNANIHNLLKYDKLELLFDDQDLIYSSGLIDYFSDKIAAKMIEILYKKLKQNGKLIIGNVSSEDRHRAYSEILGEWYINRRDETKMLRLTERIKDNKKIEIMYEEETKMNLFLIINKL